MKKASLETLLAKFSGLSYEEQSKRLLLEMKDGRLKPVKASGTNGKKPALYREYWILEKKKDYHDQEEELKYHLHPMISIDYYLSHPAQYEKDRRWVDMLSDYLKSRRERLGVQESVSERSFEIWNREKFLTREQGLKILKRCGLTADFLNMYATTEPLAYYTHTRKTPQNLLILENKDPFYSMRRHLMDGNQKVLGTSIGTLIYGAGKGILRSFLDFSFCVEPYMKQEENVIYYFGDLDYEGIGIYESLAENFQEAGKIRPFCAAYEAMLKKAEKVGQLPDTKEQQNRNIKTHFFSHFSEEEAEKMRRILEQGRYIPQEILNGDDF